jgi:alpha-L-fucosidase
MLNVGPDGQGLVPEPAQEALRAAGTWIARYPQVIYQAEASPWNHALPWGDVVVNDGKLYLAVFAWPRDGKLYLPGLQSEIASVKLLSHDKKLQKLTFVQDGRWTVIHTPFQAADKLISVIEITLKSDVKVDNMQSVDPELGLTLSVKFSQPDNCQVYYKKWMEKFGEWKHLHQIGDWRETSSTTWEIEVKTPGRYFVELTYASNGPCVWNIRSDEDQILQNRQNGSSIYHTQPIGWIAFEKAGRHSLTVTIPEGEREKTSLSAIKISPVALHQ